mmetsp:Transcript_132661/g.383558  ORF Transcript_132661/g.383558 Transcript_132661/m.383558 type:complete len:330 (-) Transcript_132661:68-1057(-)
MSISDGGAESGDDTKGHTRAPSAWRIAFQRAIRDLVLCCDNCIERCVRLVSMFMKVLGPALVLFAHGLIAFVAYTYLLLAWPFMDAPGGFLGKVSIAAIGVFLITNALYNYWGAILRDAGTPPLYSELTKVVEDGAPKPRQCQKCGRHKPTRAHHCSICRRCVLKMDHHCPWVNNCVGFGNYNHFCLFMLFLAMSCVFAATVFLWNFPDVVLHFRRFRRLPGTRYIRQCIATSFMICISIFIALCILGGFHAYLVLTNQTTIEFQSNMINRREARRNAEYFRNPYDLGRTRNFQQVFGPNQFFRFRWLFPFLAQRPTGDGIVFPSLRMR